MPQHDRPTSAAYQVLRPSARRLLAFVDTEIARQGGRAAIHNDQLAMIGSRRIWVAGLAELDALGLVEAVRVPKRALIRRSDRWQEVTTTEQAQAISKATRLGGGLPVTDAAIAGLVPEHADLVRSPAYQALRPSARRALHLILRRGSGARITLDEFGMPRPTALRAVRQLRGLAFVTVGIGERQANVYTVGDGWRAVTDTDDAARRLALPRPPRSKLPKHVHEAPSPL